MARKSKKQASRNNGPGFRFKQLITDTLELPKEVLFDVPKITIIGNENILIENYKGIIEYEDNKIRINTVKGIIGITGQDMLIKEINSENIMVEGNIKSLEFVL